MMHWVNLKCPLTFCAAYHEVLLLNWEAHPQFLPDVNRLHFPVFFFLDYYPLTQHI